MGPVYFRKNNLFILKGVMGTCDQREEIEMGGFNKKCGNYTGKKKPHNLKKLSDFLEYADVV